MEDTVCCVWILLRQSLRIYIDLGLPKSWSQGKATLRWASLAWSNSTTTFLRRDKWIRDAADDDDDASNTTIGQENYPCNKPVYLNVMSHTSIRLLGDCVDTWDIPVFVIKMHQKSHDKCASLSIPPPHSVCSHRRHVPINRVFRKTTKGRPKPAEPAPSLTKKSLQDGWSTQFNDATTNPSRFGCLPNDRNSKFLI